MEGFRAAFRRPSLTLGEITWRWSVGATAIVLFFFGFFEFLDTLPVTSSELLLLRTRHPYLIGQALARILRGSQGRGVLSLALAALLIGVVWMIAAALGRMVTVNAILEYFRREVGSRIAGGTVSGVEKDVARNVSTGVVTGVFGATVRLSFLRMVVMLAVAVGFIGAGILGSFVSPATDPQAGLAFFIFLPLAGLIAFVGWALNWLLSLAGMFAVRDHETALGAIAGAVGFCRERTGPVFAVSTWTGLAHLVLFGAATTVVGFPLGLAGILPGRFIVAVIALVTMAYFAIADWLYMARLAGYVYIAETPEALLKPAPFVPPAPSTPLQTTIDRDEPILSDVPGLIPET